MSNPRRDPLTFVLDEYPWQDLGCLEDWQEKTLKYIGDSYGGGRQDEAVSSALRIAIATGHSAGCTALCAWVIHWFVSEFSDAQVVASSNTERTLISILWPELRKWLDISKSKSEFTMDRNVFSRVVNGRYPPCAYAIPSRPHEPELFAGMVSENILVVFDEPSKIPEVIWDTVEGSMCTTNAIFLVIGKQISNTDKFAQCFSDDSGWWTMRVDSMEVSFIDKTVLTQWENDYGDESDFFRIRVRGLPANE